MDNNNQVNQNNVPLVPPIPVVPPPQSIPVAQNQILVRKNDSPVLEKSSRKWILIEIILAILLLISISLYFIPEVGQKAYEENLKAKTPEITIANSNLSTSGWKTFEGKAIGISFKYPSNWFEEDSTWISEKKPKPPSTNTNVLDLSDDNRGITINLIQVQKDLDPSAFDRIKSYKLNEPQVESDEYGGRSITKIKEGKLDSGEEYLMYFYAVNYRDDYNEEELGPKDQPAITLAVKGKDKKVYDLVLTNYNETGKNVLSSLIPTISITGKPLEWKKYNNKTFSFSYPSEAKISESGMGFTGKQIYITRNNGDFSDPEVIIKSDKYEEAANNLDEWNYWYIDWDNFVEENADDKNTEIPESEIINENRVIKGSGVGYIDGAYVDYGTKYFVFRGGYVIEVLGLTGSEEVTEKIVKSILIDPIAAGETPDLSIYNEDEGI